MGYGRYRRCIGNRFCLLKHACEVPKLVYTVHTNYLIEIVFMLYIIKVGKGVWPVGVARGVHAGFTSSI